MSSKTFVKCLSGQVQYKTEKTDVLRRFAPTRTTPPPPQKKKHWEDLSSLRGAIDLTFHLCTLDPTTNSTSPALLEGKGWNTTVHCRGAMLRNVYGTHVNCAMKNAFCGKRRKSLVEQKACKKNRWPVRVIRWELKEHHAKRSSQINTNYNHAVSMCYTQISEKKSPTTIPEKNFTRPIPSLVPNGAKWHCLRSSSRRCFLSGPDFGLRLGETKKHALNIARPIDVHAVDGRDPTNRLKHETWL